MPTLAARFLVDEFGQRCGARQVIRDDFEGDGDAERFRGFRERVDASARGVAIGAAACTGGSRPAEVNDQALEGNPAADVQCALGFRDGLLALGGIGARERRVDDRRVD